MGYEQQIAHPKHPPEPCRWMTLEKRENGVAEITIRTDRAERAHVLPKMALSSKSTSSEWVQLRTIMQIGVASQQLCGSNPIGEKVGFLALGKRYLNVLFSLDRTNGADAKSLSQ